MQFSRRTIYKYPLYAPHNIIEMPVGAIPRFVATQMSEVMLWVEVDALAQATEERTFVLIGTGQQLPVGATYIGSVQNDGYVWHLHEVKQ